MSEIKDWDKWERSHQAIEEAFSKLLKKNKRAPRQTELAKETGLSKATIQRHIKHFDFQQFSERMKHYKFLTPKVIESLAHNAIENPMSSADRKLWFQLIENFNEGVKLIHDLKDLSDEELLNLKKKYDSILSRPADET